MIVIIFSELLFLRQDMLQQVADFLDLIVVVNDDHHYICVGYKIGLSIAI